MADVRPQARRVPSVLSIGDAVVGGTPKAVLFIGSTGHLAEDETNLSWDDALFVLSVNSGDGQVEIKTRALGDVYPSPSTGSSFIYLHGVQNQKLGLSFYEFGELIQFSGDGGGTPNRSVLEFHGQVGASTMVPVMTLVCGPLNSEHEVHVARNPADDDAIIHSYVQGGTPAIFTEATKSATLDIGVRRTRVVQVGTASFGSYADGTSDLGVAGHRWKDFRWTGQLLAPNGTAGAPSRSYAADPTTGDYFDALNGFMNFTVGGVAYVGIAGNAVQLKDGVVLGWTTGIGTVASDVTIKRNAGDLHMAASGKIRFGTFAGLGVEVLAGSITIKDDGGTLRKLAVIA